MTLVNSGRAAMSSETSTSSSSLKREGNEPMAAEMCHHYFVELNPFEPWMCSHGNVAPHLDVCIPIFFV